MPKVTVTIDNVDKFINQVGDLADKAAKKYVSEIGVIASNNFKDIAAADWTNVPEPKISSPFESGLNEWSVDVAWGAPGSVPSQLSSGQYEPVLPIKDADNPVSVSLPNQNALAKFFPSRSGSKQWSTRKVVNPDPKPRNYDQANVNYILDKQLNLLLVKLSNAFRITFS